MGEMRYRKLGKWGLKVSEISLGAWVTFGDVVKDKETVREIVGIAYEGGVNFFDNADVYAKGLAEEIMGEILQEFPRHTLVLSTKAYWPMSEDPNDRGLSRKHLLESITKSLKRLKTDYVDIFFAHRFDPEVPMEEIVYAMHTIVEKGYALYWGTSEWPAARIAEAVTFAKENGLHPPVVEQPQYSMLYRERVENEILPEAERFGMGLVVWSPWPRGCSPASTTRASPRKPLRPLRPVQGALPHRGEPEEGAQAQGGGGRARPHPHPARPGLGAEASRDQ